MRRRTIVLGVAAALALAVAATAVAAPRGGPFGLLGGHGDDRRAEHAGALASKLGVEPERVERAMRELHDERRAAHEARTAAALASELDVPVADARRALERGRRAVEEQAGRHPFRRGRQTFLRAVAAELGKTRAEVARALRAARRAELERGLDEAVREGRLTERQAGALRRRMESGRGPGGHRHPGGRGLAEPGGHRGGGPDIIVPGPGPGAGAPPELELGPPA